MQGWLNKSARLNQRIVVLLWNLGIECNSIPRENVLQNRLSWFGHVGRMEEIS